MHVAVALLLSVVGVLIFCDFIFGAKVLLYKDSGGDSVNDTYPNLVHLSGYLDAHGLPSWSFSNRMSRSGVFRMKSFSVFWLIDHNLLTFRSRFSRSLAS